MIKASIIIPVKNGGEKFRRVIDKVLSQEVNFDYEIILIDSGSSDGSLEYIKSICARKNNVNYYIINPKEFGHGKTRNYGVSKAKGDYVVFLTQDALPYNNTWLKTLIRAFQDDPEVAGVFGKHLPYSDSYPVEKKQIIDHFDIGFGRKRLKVKILDNEDYSARKGWYAFYSDNNSCMRRSVMKKIPFKDVWMAEDQNWARDILEAGYAKVYEPNAIVYHSHRYNLKTMYKRMYDEYRFHATFGNVAKASVKDFVKFYYDSYRYSRQVINRMDLSILKKCSWLIFYLVYDLVRAYGYFQGTNGDDTKDIKNSMQKQIINS